MCGITGIIDLHGENRADPAIVRDMCASIAHRGPDGDGFYSAPDVALGMRRLSIIDVGGSDQPLYSSDRSIAVVFNGEIYNYRELRQELRRDGFSFYTDGDGETLIHLYERDGLAMFQHLRGMYAFALWDTKNVRLVVAVDHIGMKPLYLHEQDGMLRFASEVKGLFVDERLQPELNLPALDTYLSFGFQVGPETLFKGVRRLMPGHVLVVEDGEVTEKPFWRFGEHVNGASDTRTEADIVEQARELLRDSVRLHLRSDVPLGLFLSGGVDSAAILALMAQEDTQAIRTFTVGYDTATRDNELLHAREIAQHFNTDHHERVIDAAQWWDGFLSYVYHQDEPTANASAVSLMLLAEETAKHVKVVLTGMGGDELFAGYPHHRNIPALLHRQQTWGQRLQPFARMLGALEPYYPAMKRFRIIGALPTYLPQLQRIAMDRDEALMRAFSFDGMVFSDALRERLYSNSLSRYQGQKRHVYGHVIAQSWQENPYNTAQALVINTWLHGNALLHVDKVTMAHSLEARVPLFDPVLLDFAAKIPPELRLKRNKHILREALKPYLPAFALQRPKQPFSTPIRGWFEHDLRDNIREVLLAPDATIKSLFNRDELERVLNNHFAGREKQEEVVFRLLTLELWARRFEVTI
ncbi:MAG: asparagine synthase (glutamine-hydrolyzing) [Chloroflexota bacterium]